MLELARSTYSEGSNRSHSGCEFIGKIYPRKKSFILPSNHYKHHQPSSTMKTFKHDIKVALLGNVSTGKTMTMNALFGNKYGEVSMKRTTAAVNYFKISTSPESTDPSGTAGSWHPETDEPRNPESIQKEISEDNRRLREDTSSTHVQEKWFDIQLDEQLCEMRIDTRLVIVDIPGINEAGACSKYKEYVDEKWHTFDCVVLVMDGKQGVNTEDQVLLLNLVKSNKERIKNVPVIILFNKVDDPEDQEQAELIQEAYQEIEALFCSKRRLHHNKMSLTESKRRLHHKKGSLTETKKDETMTAESPIICNDENAPVRYGIENVSLFYCGRHLGRDAIPGSDGRCGPTNGPQCESCKRLQSDSTSGGSGPAGTKIQPFLPTTKTDGTSSIRMQSISAMEAYENKSFEELRYEDHVPKPSGEIFFGVTAFSIGSSPAPSTPGGFIFAGRDRGGGRGRGRRSGRCGTPTPAAPVFGGGGAFASGASRVPSNPFGTQSQFSFGAAPSHLAASENTTRPSVDTTTPQQQNEGAEVVTPNERKTLAQTMARKNPWMMAYAILFPPSLTVWQKLI